MSPEVVFVDRNTPLAEVAETLLQNKIHRVLVMDDRKQLFGIISATDFVRLVRRSQGEGRIVDRVTDPRSRVLRGLSL